MVDGTVTPIPFPDESPHTVSHHTEICQRTQSNHWQSLGLSLSPGLWAHHTGFQNERVLSPPAVAVTGLLLNAPGENNRSHFLTVMGAPRGIQA